MLRFKRRWRGNGVILLVWVMLFASACVSSPTENRPLPSPTAAVTPSPLPIGVDFATLPPPTQAEIVPLTPTPRPSPTVTSTPTPRIYVIAEGDTLLGIAIQSDTTTEVLGTLNPGVRPEALQIGQEIVLPPETPVVGADLSAAELPIDLAITQLQIFPTSGGQTWVIGLVENRGETWADGVQVALSNPAFGEVTVWLDAPIVGPGQRAAFGALVPQPLSLEAEVDITVAAGAGLPSAEALNLVPLEASEVDLRVEDGFAVVRGRLARPGESNLVAVELVVIYFDRQDQVIGFARERFSAGGESTLPFEVVRVPPGGVASRVEVVAFGRTGAGE